MLKFSAKDLKPVLLEARKTTTESMNNCILNERKPLYITVSNEAD